MNIYDIAKEAGVSISTVSKYLNNKKIRPELKEKVEMVVKKYNFKPNALGRGLAIKSMKTIAVMVVDIRNPYYAEAAFEIDRALSPKGYRVVICNTLGSVEGSISYIDSLLNINVDGIVFIGSIFEFLNEYKDILEKINDTPVVCSNGKLLVNRCSEIYVNDYEGIYNMTKYIYNKVKGKIAYIKYMQTTSSEAKVSGYMKAIEELDLNPYVYYIDNIYDGQTPTRKILEDNPDIKGIITGEDLIALSAINYLTTINIKPGKDILVSGYNASEYCVISPIKITSVDNKPQEVSKCCAEALEKMIDDKDFKTKITIEPALSLRDSA